MELVQKLEKTISGWLKPIPNLPVGGRKWLASNVWWLILVSAIISTIGLIFSVSAVFAYWAFVPLDYYGYATTVTPYGAGWIISALVSLIFTVIIVLLSYLAVGPLRALRHQGWQLLFLVYLISAVEVVLGAVVTFNVFSFIGGIIAGAIGLAIGGYFLFQIRSYFGAGTRVIKSTGVKAASKK